LSFASACDRGKVREENQDRVCHVTTPLGELVIVADGIGGYRGGATAAQIVVDSIVSCIASEAVGTSPARAIANAAAIANTSIIEAAASGDAAFRHMGSTVVLALLIDDGEKYQAWVGHIGDSRAFNLRSGRLDRLTRDHSAVQALIDQNLLAPEDARSHPEASVLTRSLGHVDDVEIEIGMTALEIGDTLLLCTDGLWGFVPEEAMEDALADQDLDSAAEALLALALEAGGHDNIGIELVRLSSTPVAAPAAEAESAATATTAEVESKRESPLPFAAAFLVLAIVAAAVLAWWAWLHHWIS
jgi:protein phosphatase